MDRIESGAGVTTGYVTEKEEVIMADAAELMKERMQLFDNVYNFTHNKRVPTVSNYFT